MSAPTPSELIDAVATILESTATAGIVVRDPLVEDERDRAQIARLVMDPTTGEADGWLVSILSEDEPSLIGADGYSQNIVIACEGLVTVNPARSPETSHAYAGQKVADAKAAFALQANRRLGFTTADVRQSGLWAPEGLFKENFDVCACHVAPMQLRVFVQTC